MPLPPPPWPHHLPDPEHRRAERPLFAVPAPPPEHDLRDRMDRLTARLAASDEMVVELKRRVDALAQRHGEPPVDAADAWQHDMRRAAASSTSPGASDGRGWLAGRWDGIVLAAVLLLLGVYLAGGAVWGWLAGG